MQQMCFRLQCAALSAREKKESQSAHHLNGGDEYIVFTQNHQTDDTVLLMAPSNLNHRYGDNNSSIWARREELIHIQHACKESFAWKVLQSFFAASQCG